MSAYETSGSTILKWLDLVEPEFASTILVGCGLDDGESEELLPIVSLDIDDNCLNCTLDGQIKRFPMAAVRTLSIVDERPSAPLRKAIDNEKTPVEREFESAQDYLKSKPNGRVYIGKGNFENNLKILDINNDYVVDILTVIVILI